MTPPQDDNQSFTYTKPKDKIDYLAAIMTNLGISQDKIESSDGNLTTNQMRILYDAIFDKYGSGIRNEHIVNSKPQMAENVAQILAFDEDQIYVGAKNGVIQLSWFRQIWEVFNDAKSLDIEETHGSSDGDPYSIFDKTVDRLTPKSESAYELTEQIRDGKISIPHYQRSDNQWNHSKKQNLVDSMLKDIPMPTIVLGQVKGKKKWHLVDGQQRLTNFQDFHDGKYGWKNPISGQVEFFDSNTENNPEFGPEMRSDLKDKILKYHFVVERIVCPSVRDLALIYERYNTSGKALNSTQVRLALHYQNSYLHHSLLAIAGGPFPNEPHQSDSQVAQSLGVTEKDIENIKKIGVQAKSIRRMLPNITLFKQLERNKIKNSTEITYDLLCRLAGYVLYEPSNTKFGGSKTPSANFAINQVLHRYNGTNEQFCKDAKACHSLAVRIVDTMEKVNQIFGEFAWKKLTYIEPEDRKAGENTIWKIGKSVNGWCSQVQFAGIYANKHHEKLMLLHRDTIQTEWTSHYDACMNKIQQNGVTIWDAQHKWVKRFTETLDRLAKSDLAVEGSERAKSLREEAQDMMSFFQNEDVFRQMLENKRQRLVKHEYEFLLKCIEEEKTKI